MLPLQSIYHTFLQDKLKKVPGFKPNEVNITVKKDSPKVVDMVDMEDLGDKVGTLYILSLKDFIYTKHYCPLFLS